MKSFRAIDISSNMIEIAEGKVDREDIGKVTIEKGTIEETRVPDEFLDVVLGPSILHLLENMEEPIAEVPQMGVPARDHAYARLMRANENRSLEKEKS